MTLQESIQIRVYRRDSANGVYMLDSTIGDSAVISASIKRQCSADSSVEIGGAYAATLNLQARITGTDAFNIRGAKLEVLSKYSTEAEYKSRGTFWVTDATRVGSIYTISAQDALGWTDTSSYNDTSSAGIKGVGAALRSKHGKSGACIDTWAEWDSIGINQGWLERLTVLTNSFIQSQTGIKDMISWHWQPPGYDTLTAAEKQNPSKIWEVCNWYANSNILDTSKKPVTETRYNALMYLIDDTMDEDNSTGSADSDTPRDYYKHLAALAFGFIYSRPEDGALALGQYGLSQYGTAYIGMADIEAGSCNIAEYTVELLRTMARVELEGDRDTWSSVTHNSPDYATASFQRYTLENNPFLDGFAKDFVLQRGYSLSTIAYSMWRARYQPDDKVSRQYNIRPFSCVVHTAQRYHLGQKIQITYKREDEDTAQTYDSVITSIEWAFRGGTSLACGGEDSRVLADCTKATKADRARKEALNRCRAIERRLKSTNATMGLQKTQINSLQTQKADKSDLHTHANMDILNATEAAFTSAKDDKLAGIASGAEVNQNAFSTVRVGTTGEFSFSASTKKDIITLSPGVGVTLTLDADRKTVTFSSHTHANADTLDKITADVYAEIMGAKNKAHTHSNKGTLDKITDVVWNQVFGQSHTHANADILDATTASFTTDLLTKLNGFAAKLTELWDRCTATFLSRSGGKMTGTIDTATYKTEITVNTAKSTSDTPTIVAGGAIEASGAMIDKLTALRSFIGTYKNTANNSWYNIISTRHRNGYDDGDRRGMVIYSDMGGTASNLRWNRQGDSGTWQGVRTLLDSANYSNQMATELTTENLNDGATNGICGLFYAAANNTCKNAAVSGKAFFLIAIRIAANAKTQVAIYPHNNAIYMRSWAGNDWTAWRQI